MAEIAITTITYNAANHITRCLESVRAQSCPADEYVVIDGKSNDGTVDILKKAEDTNLISQLVIEPDDGISDAFNKAWKTAKAEYVCTVNADDHLSPNHIEIIKGIIRKDNPDIITSILCFRHEKRDRYIYPRLPHSMPPIRWINPAINHPGMVIRRSLLEDVGGYDVNYKIAMDVDLFYKLLKLNPKIVINTQQTVFQEDGGVSQQNWRCALREMYTIEINHGRKKTSALCAYYWRMAKKQLKDIILFVANR